MELDFNVCNEEVNKKSIRLSFSRDCSGNPFINCNGFKAWQLIKRLKRKAGKCIADKYRTIRSKRIILLLLNKIIVFYKCFQPFYYF